MQTLIALLVAAAAASVIARPPGPTPASLPLRFQGPQRMRAPPPLPPEVLGDYLMPRMSLPHYVAYDDSPSLPENDWFSKEIERISRMDEDEQSLNPEEAYLMRLFTDDVYVQNLLESPVTLEEPFYSPDSIQRSYHNMKPISIVAPEPLPVIGKPQPEDKRGSISLNTNSKDVSDNERKKFALTPMDEEYYKPITQEHKQAIYKNAHEGHGEGGKPQMIMQPRQIRQNPLIKQKHLLESDFSKLKAGLANKEYRLPVSLLPTNLRWLKVSHPDKLDHDDDVYESSHEEGEPLKDSQVHRTESAADPADSIYSVALIAAVGAALTMAIVGFAFGWYTLSKKAKAAADVDYPAYGVTGPTVDTSGDRKLAHSAHMYHYQHQKQQIIAMERNGMDHRAGSISDPESEEENEEGDYTVYECPGFATTGDMEVKNPLFSEDPTPVTPGKCEVVKQQPKE